MPGESIQVIEGGIKLYDKENPQGIFLKEDYLKAGEKTSALNGDMIKLGSDEYYVLGDNRVISKDSRFYGAIESKLFIGRVMKTSLRVE